MEEIHKYTDENDFDIKDIAWGRIQWKGTNICIDIHCKCGYLGHIDGEFFYYYKCPECGKCYSTGARIKLVEITEEMAKKIEEEHHFHSDDPNPGYQIGGKKYKTPEV